MAGSSTSASERPILWQLQISHYNEKVRWALDHKRIPHVRRSLPPGPHAIQAKRLTGNIETTPVLSLDGRAIGDSTHIIAALEERWPERPLYPADEAQLRRALGLEEFFDEELGPHLRRAIYDELLSYPELTLPLFTNGQRPLPRLLLRLMYPVLRVGMRHRMNIYKEPAEASRERVVAAMDRLEAEIGPSGYLVGDSFTVADLTAAALFYPVALPPEFPYPSIAELPEPTGELIAELRERPGGQWVTETYRRHRNPGTAQPRRGGRGKKALVRAT